MIGIGFNMQAGFGSGILDRAMGMSGGMSMMAGMNIGGMGMSMGMGFGMDSSSFSPDAMMGGGSNFFHPLMSGGFGSPQCGSMNGMGMIPGMMNPGMMGMGGGQQMQMMQMMMQLMQMMMQMMQQNGMGGGMMGGMPGMMGGGMPGMGGGMPGFGMPGGFGCPMGMGMPGMGGGFPGMGGGYGMPGGGGYGSPVGMNPYGGGGTPSYGGGSPSYDNGSQVGGAGGGSSVNFANGDKGMSSFIDNYLQGRGSPAAGQGAGDLFTKYGKQYGVDPLVLLAISQHETNHGKLGVGIRKMLGVGAYDSNPNGKTPYDGMEQQIRSGAKTFNNLRAKGGSNADASIADQLAAVNKAGWATDKNWHNAVQKHYNQITGDAKKAGATNNAGSTTTSPSGSGQAAVDLARKFEGQESYKIKGKMPNFTAAGGQTNNCADFVSSALESTGRVKGHHINVKEFEKSLINQGYKQVSAKDAQPGDVWMNHSRGHTELVSKAGGTATIGSNNDRQGHQVISERAKSTTSGVYYHLNKK